MFVFVLKLKLIAFVRSYSLLFEKSEFSVFIDRNTYLIVVHISYVCCNFTAKNSVQAQLGVLDALLVALKFHKKNAEVNCGVARAVTYMCRANGTGQRY